MLLYHLISIYTGDKSGVSAFTCVLIYDFFAFVTELPLGILLDRRKVSRQKAVNTNGLIAAYGCAIIGLVDIISFFNRLSVVFIIPLAIAAGFANAAFHLGSGIDVIGISDRKASYTGIFISTGALGLFLGTNAMKMRYDILLFMGIALLAASLLLLRQYFDATRYLENIGRAVKQTYDGRHIAGILLLFLVIAFRSFMGFASKKDWRIGFVTGFAAVIMVFLGKFFGGILADRTGWKRMILLTLPACAILSVFSQDSLIAGCIVLFLFNTTMSICMIGLANLLPQWTGAAFGLNTAALFLGFVISHMIEPMSGTSTCIMILFFASILLFALYIAPEMEDRR